MVALLGLLACAAEPTLPQAPVGPPITGLEVQSGALALTAATAEIDANGDGRGAQVTATAPALEITGATSEWSLAAGTVRFEGEVRAVRGDFVLRADRLDAELRGDRVVRATAVGQVRVTNRGREAQAQRAVLHAEDGRVELLGEPEIRDGGHRMTGDRIVLFLEDERVVCDRCRLKLSEDALEPGR